MPKIWIDAGHGGVQPGICYGGRVEKAYTLPTAIALQNELERCGFTVKQTRTTDVDVTVDNRAKLSNAWGADYFVSIHLNGSVGHNAMGAETWHSITGGQSKALAQAVQKEVAALGYKDRGLKSAANSNGKDTLAVIRETNAPAVLVEVGFLDWDADMRIFDAAKAAQAIARGICKHTGIAYKPATAAATAPPITGLTLDATSYDMATGGKYTLLAKCRDKPTVDTTGRDVIAVSEPRLDPKGRGWLIDVQGLPPAPALRHGHIKVTADGVTQQCNFNVL